MAGLPGRPGIALADCPAQTAGSRALLARVEAEAPDLESVEVDGDADGGQVILTGAAAEVARVARALPPAVTVLGVQVGARGPGRPQWIRGRGRGTWSWRRHAPGDGAGVAAPEPSEPPGAAGGRAGPAGCGGPTHPEIGCGIGTLSLADGPAGGGPGGRGRRAGGDAGCGGQRGTGRDCDGELPGGGRAHAVRRLLAGSARFERALLHAMRRPFGPDLLPRLPLLGVEQALYLAPSAAGLARDLAAGGELRATRLAVLDQLPGTVHLLTLATLERG
ncbi:MAG: hypothetical protein R3F60_33900 [bacterium]